MPEGGDVALACASLLVDELVRGGVEHACLTPGSRSTALALAVARHPGLRVHVHIDERSSAFFALGIAKATGRPAVALCSSGTAAANHLPAVVEASMARTPLIVLTADRPPELHDTGANQTIEQQGLYGGFVRWSFDTGVPDARPGAARYWRSLGARAVMAATGSPAGPVHVNVPIREPLLPTGAPVDLGDGTTGREDAAPWELVADVIRTLAANAVDALAERLAHTQRVAVVAGTLRRASDSVRALCAARGWPLLAEPASGLRQPGVALAAGQLLVADAEFRCAQRADVVLQIGATPTTRAVQTFAQEAQHLVVVDPDALHPDPARQAALTLPCDVEPLATALLARLGPSRTESPWSRTWQAADSLARNAADALLDSWDEPFEGRIARDVAAATPGGVLFAGSSMPVRDIDAYMAPRDGLQVIANRGASGIDGTVSTALGVAATGEKVTALIGDLALLHDGSGLVWSGRSSCDLVLVVVDNDGGGIFSLLPQAQLDTAEFEELFATPHGSGIDFAALAAAAGAGYQPVHHAGDLRPALAGAVSSGGVQLVHVRVDRSRAAQLRAQVAEHVHAALQRSA